MHSSKRTELDIRPGIVDNVQVYLIRFPYSIDVIKAIKELKIARWNPEIRCWVMPRDHQKYRQLSKHVSPLADAILHTDLPDEIYTGKSPVDRTEDAIAIQQQTEKRLKAAQAKTLPEVVQKDIEKWVGTLSAQRYSSSTIKVYHNAMLQFFYWLGDKNHKEVRKEDVDAWMRELVNNQQCSFAYQNQHINALRSFYKHIFSIHLSHDMIARPRTEFTLPHYLTKEQIMALIRGVKNIKHRAMLSLIYACGLRTGDLVGIKITDIDASQRLLMIRGGKGKRDRTVPLPLKMMEQLDQYGQLYRPVTYLFEGDKPGMQYSRRSLQQVFKRAVAVSGVPAEATLHWLRHSYATHLLEQGTNVRLIQQLLGHKELKTTEIYTHISKISFQQITSPFETLEEDTDEKKLKPHNPGKWLKE